MDSPPYQINRNGLLAGVGAYGFWGSQVVYLKAVSAAPLYEIIGERILFSLITLLAVLALMGNLPELVDALKRKKLVLLLLTSALLIAGNWVIYLLAIQERHVLAASLGYFLNPLVSVGLGVAFLREGLSRVQMAAMAIAAAGVAILAVDALDTLWISMSLALTFALYGFVRKLTPVSAILGLTIETLLLMPVAAGLLLWMPKPYSFGQGWSMSLLLLALGPATCIPLLLFARAAQLLPLTLVGLLQYIAPTMIFLTGWLLFGEPLAADKLVSFAFIWTALALFTWGALRGRAAQRTPV